MRQGIGCLLVEAEVGSLDGLRRCLESWRFDCSSVVAPIEAESSPHGEIVVVELQGERCATFAATDGARALAGRPSLALCGDGDAKALSLAASAGFDDILAMPVDPVELVRRLQTLATLAGLTAEQRRRADLFAPYCAGSTRASAIAFDRRERPKVALLGAAGEGQVRVVAALPPASLTYLESPAQLPALLRKGALDLILVTQPALIVAALEALDGVDGEPPMLLASHVGPPTALELPPQIDLLPQPAPMALARARLALALRIGELRRWLRQPPLGDAGELIVDSLTGLFNHGAFLDYLGTTGEHRALIGLEHDRLEQLNRTFGYAAGNRALAHMGQALGRAVRADDFAGHLGGGRFAVAVTTSSRQQLERLRCRLEANVPAGEPWQVLATAEALPVRGAPAQRLSRLFADLRRVRPAA